MSSEVSALRTLRRSVYNNFFSDFQVIIAVDRLVQGWLVGDVGTEHQQLLGRHRAGLRIIDTTSYN